MIQIISLPHKNYYLSEKVTILNVYASNKMASKYINPK